MTEDEKRLFSWIQLKAMMMLALAQGSILIFEQGEFKGTFSSEKEMRDHVRSVREKTEKELEAILNQQWEKAKN